MFKRLLSLLCALMLLPSLPFALAEETDDSADFGSFYRIPDTLTYKGGVVMRGFLKGADSSAQPLEIAYALTTMPYIILGEKTFWDISISGGAAPYRCQVIVAWQEMDADPFADDWYTEIWFTLEGDSLEYTFNTYGKYFLEFRVFDEDGQFFSFQTRIYETYAAADETDPTTVVGKVNQIIEEYITPDMSAYDRALVLHDWLIYNANYDYTYTHYDAAGVLLLGTGVCDSYARAYLMLCTAAGIECMYVSGTAGNDPNPEKWGNHGWNMVKIDGKWYHVDCTWDDPGKGGSECHDYFLVNDETLAKDHRWNRQDDLFDDDGYLPPEAEDDDYAPDIAYDYDFTCATIEEFNENFDAMVAAGKRQATFKGYYTGSDWYGFRDDFIAWYNTKYTELSGQITRYGYSYKGNLFTYRLTWRTPTDYIRIDESTLRVNVGENVTIFPVEYSPEKNAFTWKSSDPAIATVTGGYNNNPNDDIQDGVFATITANVPGETTITVTAPDGSADSVKVIVLAPFAPDFQLSAATTSEGPILSWQAIPGVTEYRIYRIINGQEILIATVPNNEVRLTAEQLPADVRQQVRIVGLRIVSGETVFTYESKAITYGKLTLTYTSTLPTAVTAIDAEAFYGDIGLTSFKVPGKVKTIGDRAFAGCTSLTAVFIPASVSSIGKDAFKDCPLQYAQVSEGSYAESWMKTNFPNVELVY